VKHFFARLWQEQDGVLSFEWTVLASLMTVGVVSGIASVRDAVIDEMGDLAQAMVTLDQSYYIEPPLGVRVHGGGFGGGGFVSTGFGGFGYGSAASGSQFIDAASYQDCYRVDSNVKVYEFPRRDAAGNRIAPPDLGPAEPAAEPAI
jgi:Flp pilus assembly pilin Flp